MASRRGWLWKRTFHCVLHVFLNLVMLAALYAVDLGNGGRMWEEVRKSTERCDEGREVDCEEGKVADLMGGEKVSQFHLISR